METINLAQLTYAIEKLRNLLETYNEEDRDLVDSAEKEIASLRKNVEKQLNEETSLLDKKIEESRKTISWHRVEIEGNWQRNEEWAMSIELYLVRKYGLKYKHDFSYPDIGISNESVEQLREKIYNLISILEKGEIT